MPKIVTTPAVILTNPKYIHNIGGTIRACSCFGIDTLMWTGKRIQIDPESKERIPREERMKGYRSVEWFQTDRPFDFLPPDAVPVAIELTESSEPMTTFEHPEKAVYVFGPEDGSVTQMVRRFCHRFVYIPTHHCVNLSAAVYMTLYDRRLKRQMAGLEPILPINEMLKESRGDNVYQPCELETPVLAAMGWDGK